MIKSFLYSLVLHFFIFLFVFCSYLVDENLMKSYVNIIETGINYDFFEINRIKTTNESLFKQLDLTSKINLYNLAKKYQNPNSSISNVPIDSIKDVIGFNFDMSKVNQSSLIKNKIINTFEKGHFTDATITSGDVIYLGPTDYKRLLASASSNVPMDIVKNDEYVLDSDIKKSKNRNGKTFKVDMDKIFTEEDIELLKDNWNERYDSKSLSKREKISIQNQFVICYKNAILKTKKQNKFNVAVVLNINRNGYIDTNNIKIEPINSNNKYSNIEYNDTINNIKLTIDYCNPIRNLPLGKYESWKSIKFVFNSR